MSKKQVAECELSFPARDPHSYHPTSLGLCYHEMWCVSHASKHATLLKGSSTGLSDTVRAPGEELGSRAVAGHGDSSSGLAMAVSALPLSDLGISEWSGRLVLAHLPPTPSSFSRLHEFCRADMKCREWGK